MDVAAGSARRGVETPRFRTQERLRVVPTLILVGCVTMAYSLASLSPRFLTPHYRANIPEASM